MTCKNTLKLNRNYSNADDTIVLTSNSSIENGKKILEKETKKIVFTST